MWQPINLEDDDSAMFIPSVAAADVPSFSCSPCPSACEDIERLEGHFGVITCPRIQGSPGGYLKPEHSLLGYLDRGASVWGPGVTLS